LFVVLPTATSGAWAHSRKGTVWWKAALVLGLCGMVGAFGGATLAAHLSGKALTVAFGALILIGGVRMSTEFSSPLAAQRALIQIPLMMVILRSSKRLRGMLASPRDGEDVASSAQ